MRCNIICNGRARARARPFRAFGVRAHIVTASDKRAATLAPEAASVGSSPPQPAEAAGAGLLDGLLDSMRRALAWTHSRAAAAEAPEGVHHRKASARVPGRGRMLATLASALLGALALLVLFGLLQVRVLQL